MTGREGLALGVILGIAGSVVLLFVIAWGSGGLATDRWCAGDRDLGGERFEVCGPEAGVKGYVRGLGVRAVHEVKVGQLEGNPVVICQDRGRAQGEVNGWSTELTDEYLKGCTEE